MPKQARADFEPARGGPFFLLSDASYGSDETAKVRFEVVDRGAVNEYGGADLYIYKIPRPLEFLQKQKNLHRVDITGNYGGEGLSNVLRHAWDTWYLRSRVAWRDLFGKELRTATTTAAPELRARAGIGAPTRFAQNTQYKPIKGLVLVDAFRYPVDVAKPIEPPAGVSLAGSSSEFIPRIDGNLLVPIGKRSPGLYLVEAMIGQHRAKTLVFVSDTVAVTKISAGQLLAWTAHRRTGQPVSGTQVSWTDGTGVLKSGTADARGIAVLERAAPEQTYVLGEDPSGGVFVSENFYYDSEIYNAKFLAVTDRPLYRPGDAVSIKVFGRDFVNARDSRPVAAGEIELEVFDPNGLPVTRQKLRYAVDAGADTSFRLPDNAPAGGYEVRFAYKGGRYSAAFRVAEYQKPHFEIAVLPTKADFKTGEVIDGRIQITYPDGKPVKNASVELSVRSQQMTMVDGDLGYGGHFPVKLTTATLDTDAKGIASFELPAASVPSRYILTVLATDGAAYRVRTTKEILVERASGAYTVRAARNFSGAGETVAFTVAPVGEPGQAPARWDWVRLEDRQRAEGSISDPRHVEVRFALAGTYTLTLRDAAGNVIGAASHFVAGDGGKAPVGSIGIVFDRSDYRPGEIAEALVSFPVEVANALLTLERDRVERSALLSRGDDWITAERLTPTQWRVRLPVREEHGPNVTLSVAYVKDGDYVFQNQGIKVAQPQIELEFRTDKATYAPGEKVTVDVRATVQGTPAAKAVIAVGVVDEMIYVLQPEIAPHIFDFFYHPRRNNVRTSASLSFIGYDSSRPHAGKAPARRQVQERALKVLERPRREEVDTAYWNPTLSTDAEGKARFSFTMPDSLTRWRITGRAIDVAGTVGQKLAFVRSEKPLYVRWTSPDWARDRDVPVASVALFNQLPVEQVVEFVARGGVEMKQKLTLKPGANFLPVPFARLNGQPLTLGLQRDGRVIDAVEVGLKVEPTAWLARRTLAVDLKAGGAGVSLPADARKLRLRFASGADAQIARIADDLIDFPYGCVEQTASRLIPLSLAIGAHGAAGFTGTNSNGTAGLLRQKLYSQRFRLAQMAGPNAVFSWWGDRTQENAFITAYAYYADWLANRTLGTSLPREHWDHLLDVYAKTGYQLPPLQRALALWWMKEIGLPVASMAAALAVDLERSSGVVGQGDARASLTLVEPESRRAVAAARVLNALTQRGSVGASENASVAELARAGQPFESALLLLAGKLPATRAEGVLGSVRQDMPTFERAMTLVWAHRALGGKPGTKPVAAKAEAPWVPVAMASGQSAWTWPAGEALPTRVSATGGASAGTTAFIDYESRAPETGVLPVQVQRKIYRLIKQESVRVEPASEGGRRGRPAVAELGGVSTVFARREMKPGETVRTDELYLDEIVLRSRGGSIRYGLLEAALPPGATVERGTWGVALKNGEAAEAMEKARHEPGRTGYSVAVDPLSGEMRVQHLVRFAQRGQFALPPARFYRMYQPERKAFEAREAAWTQIRVE